MSANRELSVAEVRALAQALGLPLAAEDLAEVTHRLNAYFQALAPLASLPLADAAPYPIDPRPAP